MNTKANPKIDNFIQDLLFVDEDKGEIAISLRKLVLEIAPSAKEDLKYGGLAFVSDKRLFCGIFIRKKHISVEFDRGAEMQDPDNFLEGSGKNRRHLKIFQQEGGCPTIQNRANKKGRYCSKSKKKEYFLCQNQL